MTKARSAVSRRAFIASVAAAGGGLLVGLRLTDFTANDLHQDPGEIHNWITVAPNNTVTIRIAQMELGQGAMTAMAQLLAEELGVDWSNMRTEFVSIRTQLRRNRIYGRTDTSKSNGVRNSQQLLRTCGAQIRTMLLRAAANRLGVPEVELLAKNSVVTHIPTGSKLTYGELASAAAAISVPDAASVRLKDPSEWEYIGKSLPRVDIPTKVNGAAIYGIDITIPGMKHAAVVMSPVIGGKLKSYDAGAVLSRSGVRKVVELTGNKFGDESGAPMDNGIEAVAIVADYWWQAKSAIEAMTFEWDGGRWATVNSASILAGMRAGLNISADTILDETGNVDAAISSAAQVLEADYFVPYLEQAAMEPINCAARVAEGHFEVWAPTQRPEDAIKTAAQVAGLPVSSGDLHVTQVGGGFGRRLESDFVAQAVQIAKAMKGTPVKLVWSREDTMRHGFYRPATLVRVRGALDKEGNLTGWTYRIVAPSDSKSRVQLGSIMPLHDIPNVRVDLVVKPCQVREGFMRAVGLATNGFVTQCFIDELASAAGKDPFQFQRVLLDPSTLPDTPKPKEPSLRSRATRLRAVLDHATRKASWETHLGQDRGRGMAALEYANAFYAVIVEVTLDGKGWFNVDRVVVAGDPSFLVNPDMAEAQVEGSVAFGLTSAMYGEITIDKGSVVQGNFNDYRMLRINEMPLVETHWILSGSPHWGGVGEPVAAVVIPALINAIYDAGGPRIRSLPLKNHKMIPRET
jgi:isoquinoline 1-oxidoreductase beta subunit